MLRSESWTRTYGEFGVAKSYVNNRESYIMYVAKPCSFGDVECRARGSRCQKCREYAASASHVPTSWLQCHARAWSCHSCRCDRRQLAAHTSARWLVGIARRQRLRQLARSNLACGIVNRCKRPSYLCPLRYLLYYFIIYQFLIFQINLIFRFSLLFFDCSTQSAPGSTTSRLASSNH